VTGQWAGGNELAKPFPGKGQEGDRHDEKKEKGAQHRKGKRPAPKRYIFVVVRCAKPRNQEGAEERRWVEGGGGGGGGGLLGAIVRLEKEYVLRPRREMLGGAPLSEGGWTL